MSNNITWQTFQSSGDRLSRMRQRPVIAWLTGLSGSGKTSIADATDRALSLYGRRTVILDGDNLRHGLCRDLGFSRADRTENVRRAAEVARLMAETGLVTVVALISPWEEERAMARRIAGDIPFLEVFVQTPLSICEERDPKGLYGLARAGQIGDFTGISSPYEKPTAPDLTLGTEGRTVADSAGPLITQLLRLSAPT